MAANQQVKRVRHVVKAGLRAEGSAVAVQVWQQHDLGAIVQGFGG
jgi:hypothetical protein